MAFPACPACEADMTYEMMGNLNCPMCGNEWAPEASEGVETENVQEEKVLKDVNGNILQNGDTVYIVQDLKVGKDTLKQGTKVKNILLLEEAVNDHDIQAKVDGFGSMYLKSSVVKK